MYTIIRNILIIWPSWPFIPVGAVPLGVLLASPKYLLEIGFFSKIFVSLYLILLVFHIQGTGGILELLKLSVGIVIFICFQRTSYINRFLLLSILMLFMVDSALHMGGFRGGTWLTSEPSHSARAFYTFLFVYILYFQYNKAVIVVFGLVYLIANKSTSGALFFIFILFFMYYKKFNIRAFIRLVVVLMVLIAVSLSIDSFKNSRFVDGIARLGMLVTLVENNESLAFALTQGGSRRLSQSIAGFYVSGLFGHGLGVSNELFKSTTEGTEIDLNEVKRLEDLNVAPTSYASQITFEAGWIAFLVLFAFLYSSFVGMYTKARLLVGGFGFLQLLLFSTTTTPFPWIFMGIACNRFVRL